MLSIIRSIFITAVCTFVLLFLSIQPCTASDEGAASEVEQETVFYYTVKKGDTLWDISKHFFDSPRAWPELWSKNSQVLNPHLIYPGNRLRIYKKDGVISITQVPEKEEEVVVETVQETTPVAIQEPPKPPAPPEEIIEAPGEEVLTEKKPEIEQPSFQYTQIDRIGFIKKEPETPHAYIFKAKDMKSLISEDDIVYLQQKEKGAPALIPGTLYAVIDIRKDPITDTVTKKYIGMQHNMKGIVEITEILQNDPLLAEARVSKTFRALRIDDLLIPYKKRSPKITLTDSPAGLDGNIITEEDHKKIFAEGEIAFINKGSNDGVMPGQHYSIYTKEDLGDFIKKIDVGAIAVLHTENETSTVLITKSKGELTPGVSIRTPAR
ncbi:MAG: LysM peptidoglycan-binding domain-containing protein [Pseudomonadota bacterium]